MLENYNKLYCSTDSLSFTFLCLSFQYFNKRSHFWAHDDKEESEPGDLVMIKHLPEPIRVGVTHEVKEVVFKLGRRIDPLSGMKIHGGVYAGSDLPDPHETLKKHDIPIPNWAKNLTEKL
jgi:hypothetical protein